MTFTREQQEATRELLRAQLRWLQAYGWQLTDGGRRVSHKCAPKARDSYAVRDAMAMTHAEPLRYANVRTMRGGAA